MNVPGLESVTGCETSSASTTYVSRLTSSVSAAIATIAVRGPQAALKASVGLRKASGGPLICEKSEARFALWQSPAHPDWPAEHVVVLCRTSENIEINCHGGLAITQLILDDLQAAGCVPLDAEHFSGLIVDQESPVQQPANSINAYPLLASIGAQAELALMRASTLKVAGVFLDQVAGALAREFRQLQELVDKDDRANARSLCEQLLERAAFGTKLIAPWRLTLAGPPNVGKSSLMNALCGSSRVVVHAEAGTTRDAVETNLVLSGWPLLLTDTAGIRQAHESIEQQGIAAARLRWTEADIGLIVVDSQIGWTTTHQELLDSERPNVKMIVLNKADQIDLSELTRTQEVLNLQLTPSTSSVQTTATQADGVVALVDMLGTYLDKQQPPPGTAVPFMPEHVTWLKATLSRIRND